MDETNINKYDFLECEDGTDLFSLVGDNLRRGVHIQQTGGDNSLFLYMDKYRQTLFPFFEVYEGIAIREAGSGKERYFYPQFLPAAKGKSTIKKEFLPKEHIIVALLLYKCYYIDHQIELNSVQKFLYLLRVEMPDLKSHVHRLLARSTKERFTEMNERKIEDVVWAAFKNFRKLEWIEMEKDEFTILPAFQRVTLEFAGYINQIEEYFKDEQV